MNQRSERSFKRRMSYDVFSNCSIYRLLRDRLKKGSYMLRGQKKLEAQVRRAEIQRKEQARKAQSSGYTESQWDSQTSVDRLIKCDHYAKSSGAARISYLREEVRKARKEHKISLTLVKR